MDYKNEAEFLSQNTDFLLLKKVMFWGLSHLDNPCIEGQREPFKQTSWDNKMALDWPIIKQQRVPWNRQRPKEVESK